VVFQRPIPDCNVFLAFIITELTILPLLKIGVGWGVDDESERDNPVK
jgi:hypothetical protein